MTLNEWFAFNEKLLNCSFRVVLFRNGSVKTSDVIIDTAIGKVAAKKYFGNFTIWNVQVGKVPESEERGIKLMLWEEKEG